MPYHMKIKKVQTSSQQSPLWNIKKIVNPEDFHKKNSFLILEKNQNQDHALDKLKDHLILIKIKVLLWSLASLWLNIRLDSTFFTAKNHTTITLPITPEMVNIIMSLMM